MATMIIIKGCIVLGTILGMGAGIAQALIMCA
jgi:hypothetical protein